MPCPYTGGAHACRCIESRNVHSMYPSMFCKTWLGSRLPKLCYGSRFPGVHLRSVNAFSRVKVVASRHGRALQSSSRVWHLTKQGWVMQRSQAQAVPSFLQCRPHCRCTPFSVTSDDAPDIICKLLGRQLHVLHAGCTSEVMLMGCMD